MRRLLLLVRMMAAVGLVAGAACGGKGKSQGAGGAAGHAGTGGAGSGAGASGSGGAPITACPSSEPVDRIPCSGGFICQFQLSCTCHGCCSSVWMCTDGTFWPDETTSGCAGPPCPDGGAGAGGTG